MPPVTDSSDIKPVVRASELLYLLAFGKLRDRLEWTPIRDILVISVYFNLTRNSNILDKRPPVHLVANYVCHCNYSDVQYLT